MESPSIQGMVAQYWGCQLSYRGMDWALEQTTSSSSAKLVLIALAKHANESGGNAHPSIDRISTLTHLDRKTIMKALRSLVDQGLVSDTGKRKGERGRVKVYQLNIGGPGNDTKIGTFKEYQKRHDSESSIVPDLTDKSANSGTFNDPNNGTQNRSVEYNHEYEEEETFDPPPAEKFFMGMDWKPSEAIETNLKLSGVIDYYPIILIEFKHFWMDPDKNQRLTQQQWEEKFLNRVVTCTRTEAMRQNTNACFKEKKYDTAVSRFQKDVEVLDQRIDEPYDGEYSVKGAVEEVQQVVGLYTEICVAAGMLPCTLVTPELQSLITSRIRDFGMDLGDWEMFFSHAASKPHLTGKARPGEGYSGPFKAQLENLLNNKGFSRLDAELQAGAR